MAENKKSFVLYSDNKSIIDLLSNEQAGLLLKTLFKYVNDENPEIDQSIAIVFEVIKLQLKRDLIKWEHTKESRSIAGKASAEAKRLAKLKEQKLTNSTNVDFVEQSSTKSTVSVNVSVSDSVSDNVINEENNNTASPFSFFNSLIAYGFDKKLVSDWIKVRKTKKATNTETSFKSFINEIEKRNCNLNQILEFIIVKNWSGFKWSWYDAEFQKEKSSAKKESESIVAGRQTASTIQQNLDATGLYVPSQQNNL
jgi:hypothetical protein